jgi:fatty-acyl-CoA synthase
VQAQGEKALTVTIDAAATGPAVQALQSRLQEALGKLPLKVQVIVQ